MGNYYFFIILFSFISGAILSFILYYLINNKNKYKNDNIDISAINENIRSIQEELQNFNLAQIKIENTLVRGGSRQQGEWGEFVLVNILEESGLRADHDYVIQPVFNSNEDKLQKPDIVINLPGKRNLIIDSKVSLESWHDYCNTEDEASKSLYFNNFLNAVKENVRKLSKDNYQNLYGLNTIDAVLMFMPIEPAYIALYKEDQTIVKDALEKKIMIVCPSLLPVTLQIVEKLWQVHDQSKNVESLVKKISNLYDKAVNVYESFSQAYKAVNDAQKKLKESKDRLQDGKDSFTKQLHNIKEDGRLTTKKTFPNDAIEK
tara:strand:- start:6162 stop:7115 length:954 start_codon:yes stop_codon:yes gene_type:complete